jgi:hypothetical protein
MLSLRANPLARSLGQVNWIRTSENYERICLNKLKIFLNLAFGEVGEKN